MLQRGRVVPETIDVTEDQFHGAMIAGLGRAEQKVGRGALAYAMDLKSIKALTNIFAGTAPHPKRLWDTLAVEKTALDDIAKLYRVRIVDADREFICTECAAPALVSALKKVIEAEADGHKDHRELIDMEPELRAARAKLDAMIDVIDGLRRPRAVKQGGA